MRVMIAAASHVPSRHGVQYYGHMTNKRKPHVGNRKLLPLRPTTAGQVNISMSLSQQRPTHLPSEAIAFAVVVPEVCHFAVHDVHPGLSHRVFGFAITVLAAVEDYL